MRSITRCPACQTQFFVTEVQLNKHDGKVRCGQCLHVFDAKTQFVELDEAPIETVPVEAPPEAEPEPPHLPAPPNDQSSPEWPLIDNGAFDEDSFNHALLNQDQEPIAEVVELSATSDEIEAFAAETSTIHIANATSANDDVDDYIFVDDDDFNDDSNHDLVEPNVEDPKVNGLNDITKLTFIADNQAGYFDDLASKAKLDARKSIKKPRRWPWLLGTVILLTITVAQSIYFLRDEIVIYYPNAKPYLVKACQQLACSVNLPKQIELIVIDDSDMQEDTNYEGLMHLSSSLINKAGFNQAYPNLELTLTDVEDNPILRRVFKPSEYLPTDTNIATGFNAGEEIKIKLAITTPGIPVAGYRVFVTY